MYRLPGWTARVSLFINFPLKFPILPLQHKYLIFALQIIGMDTKEFIRLALEEDVASGDYSTLASIPETAAGKATLKIKEDGVLAGLAVAQEIFHYLEPGAQFQLYKKDGDTIAFGDTAFEVAARVHTILKAERLVLNCHAAYERYRHRLPVPTAIK